MLPTDAPSRKAIPICTGFLDYFPKSAAAIAELSRIGNEQHNPGKPLHWDRSKSTDEADCLMRHFIERGTIDTDGVRHSTKVAWRALALLEKELEHPVFAKPNVFKPGEIIPMQPGETPADTMARVQQERTAPETKFGFTVGEKVNLLYYGDERNPGTVMGFRDDSLCISWQDHPRTDISDCALWDPKYLRHGA